jgi:CheY-like chemotaxis protein
MATSRGDRARPVAAIARARDRRGMTEPTLLFDPSGTWLKCSIDVLVAERDLRQMHADSLPHPSTVSVLIVDDAAAYRKAVRALLERRGYHVVGEADCVATALNYVEYLTPDAVLLDIHLPDGDGFDLTARIRDIHPETAVLLTSSEIDDRFWALAEAHGARYVPKDQLSHVDFANFWPDADGT